jgi:hypothetical protein
LVPGRADIAGDSERVGGRHDSGEAIAGADSMTAVEGIRFAQKVLMDAEGRAGFFRIVFRGKQ